MRSGECRALVRGQISLLEKWTSFTNKIHSVLLDNGFTLRVTPLSVTGREFLAELSLPIVERTVVVVSVGNRYATKEIEQLDDQIEERAEEEETRLLMTIPGIAHYSASVIYAEIGEIDRFYTAKEARLQKSD